MLNSRLLAGLFAGLMLSSGEKHVQRSGLNAGRIALKKTCLKFNLSSFLDHSIYLAVSSEHALREAVLRKSLLTRVAQGLPFGICGAHRSVLVQFCVFINVAYPH